MWPEQSALTKSISAPPKLFPETPSIAVNVRFLSHPVWFSTLLALFLASKWSSARIGPPFGLCISASSFPMSFWQFRIHWDSSSCVSRLQTFIFDHPIFGVFTSLIESSKNYFLAFNQFPIFFLPFVKKTSSFTHISKKPSFQVARSVTAFQMHNHTSSILLNFSYSAEFRVDSIKCDSIELGD